MSEPKIYYLSFSGGELEVDKPISVGRYVTAESYEGLQAQAAALKQEAQLSDIAWTAVQEENERLRAALTFIGKPTNGSADLAAYARDSIDDV